MIYDNSVKRVTKIEDHVVRLPEGMEVPLESSKVHGITTKIMRKVGENILDVLKIFTKDLLDSDYIVAHNIKYDKTVEERIYNNNKIDWMRHLKKILFINSINICNIMKLSKKEYIKNFLN